MREASIAEAVCRVTRRTGVAGRLFINVAFLPGAVRICPAMPCGRFSRHLFGTTPDPPVIPLMLAAPWRSQLFVALGLVGRMRGLCATNSPWMG